MSTRVVVTPALCVARPHVREAFRALLGQGHAREELDEELLTRLLWLARALPAAMDVVEGLSLIDTRFTQATLEVLGPTPSRGLVTLVAWRQGDEDFVEVLVLARDAFEQRAFDAACVRIVFSVTGAAQKAPPADVGGATVDDDDTAPFDVATLDSIRLQRFTLPR